MVYGGPIPEISSGLQPRVTRVEPEVVGEAEMLNIATSLLEELIEQTICDESSDLAAIIFEVLL